MMMWVYPEQQQQQGLPLLSIPRHSPSHDDDFGDSPRGDVLAQLDRPFAMVRLNAPLNAPYFAEEDEEEEELPMLLGGPAAGCSTVRSRGRRGARKNRRQDAAKGQETCACPPTKASSCDEESSTDTPADEAVPDPGAGVPVSEAAPAPGAGLPVAKELLQTWPERATTVMLRNIPNRYTAEELLAEMLAQGFEGGFDFFYLPIDFKTKRNRGYGFINFHTAALAKQFVTAFHGQRLTRYSTQKILEISPALTQGFDANVTQFVKKDPQRIQNPWFRPMIFSRADGDSPTEPPTN